MRRYFQLLRRFTYISIGLFIIGSLWIIFFSGPIGPDIDTDDDENSRDSPPLFFCLVLSANDRHLTSSKAIAYTWGKRCDRFYFLTRLQNTSIELLMLEKFENTSDVTATTINQYTLDALMHLNDEELFSSYRWFVRAGDDSFVIVPNLRKLVNELDRKIGQNPYVYVGDVEEMHEKYGYSTSGSVMVFNRQAMKVLIAPTLSEDGPEQITCPNSIIYDHEFVHCLRNSGVQISPPSENLVLSQNLSTYRRDERLKVQ